ncbi:MAG: GNAT family N-acetyltransferase [Myxococcota bacterium]
MERQYDVRAIRHHDRADWEPLWRGYQLFYGVSIEESVSATTWSRLLDSQEPVSGALAWVGNEAIGMVHYIRHRSCWTVEDYCYLQDLFVKQESRRHGAGRALIEYVCRAAEQHGCARVYWLTQEDNLDAIKLYDKVAERSGFIQYRRPLPSLKFSERDRKR